MADTAPEESTANGLEIVKAWQTIYASDSSDEEKEAQLLAAYDKFAASIWTMIYDEADENENLEDTIAIVTNYMAQDGMKSIQEECFGVVHTLDSLEIEGLWIFNGSDPEKMFGANEDSSWYTWSRLGPEASKAAVKKYFFPTDGKLNGKDIKDTKTFP
jgi:hypothetical protein